MEKSIELKNYPSPSKFCYTNARKLGTKAGRMKEKVEGYKELFNQSQNGEMGLRTKSLDSV